MIHVDRSRGPGPEVLALDGDSPASRELAKATEFFKERRGQRRFNFSVYKDARVTDALTELFYGKCAYCESRFAATNPLGVEHFRPKGGVVERPDHPGYWWLAMVWENLRASCADCSLVREHAGVKTGKANRFPLQDESERWFQPSDENQERPLLLDPCTDFPEDHLVFDEKTGIVYSETPRGQTTIAVLGLNRHGLVKSRIEAGLKVEFHLQHIAQLERLSGVEKLIEEEFDNLKRLTDPSQEFAGFKRQIIKAATQKLKAVPEIAEAATPTITSKKKRSAKKAFSQFEQAQSSYSLNDEEGRAKYRGQRRIIERIEISDLRAISTLDLDLTSASGRTPWLMLLGENGTGKSTVLQVTALALLGAQSFLTLANAHGVHPTSYVRYGRPFGSVSVKLSGFPKPHTLVFRPDRVEFTSPTDAKTSIVFDGDAPRIEGSGWEPQTLLLAYGATRLLPKSTSPPPASGDFGRVENLFDPFVPLINAERWLLSLDQDHFDSTAAILRELLTLPADAQFVAEGERVVVVAWDARVALDRLSDGYQSVVAMAVDILEIALRLWPNPQEAEGTVLLDEVGAHLHPTWKMRIVAALRKALPGMQFLATTHDPLCLRGLGKGEVAVMRRGEDKQVVALANLPSPGDFRVDQLLTSDFFGLNSTVDPETEAIFDEYYALLALKSPEPEQTARIVFLREALKDRRHLGTTLRENLMYDAVDRIVANHRLDPAVPIADLKQEAVDEVSKIWNEQP